MKGKTLTLTESSFNRLFENRNNIHIPSPENIKHIHPITRIISGQISSKQTRLCSHIGELTKPVYREKLIGKQRLKVELFETDLLLYDLAYGNYLENEHISLLGHIKHCLRWGKQGTCENKHKVFIPKRCKKSSCPKCSDTERIRLSDFYFDLLKNLDYRLADLSFIHYTFTFPKMFWELLKTEPHTCFRLVNECLAEYLGGHAGTVMSFHNWHSAFPLSNYYPHVHGFMVNYTFENHDYNQIPNYQDLDKLRLIWKQTLERFFGCEINGKLDIYFQYIKFKGSTWKENTKRFVDNKILIKHRLKYMFRTYVVDVRQYCLRYWVQRFDETETRFLNELSSGKGKKHIQSYGWLADGVKNKYLSLVGCHHETRAERKLRKKIPLCPVCEFPLEIENDYFQLSEMTNDMVVLYGHEH